MYWCSNRLIVWSLLLRWLILPVTDDFSKDEVGAAKVARPDPNHQNFLAHRGALIRGDTSRRRLALVFTGDEYADGGTVIRQTLQQHRIRASFFLTGRFYRNPAFRSLLNDLHRDGHYLGPHSNAHLLYCDWTKRDSLLVTQRQFRDDLEQNYAAMQSLGIQPKRARYFLPPYEWYNDTIAAWTRATGRHLINYTPGTLSHADYTTPDLKAYRSSDAILHSIHAYEQGRPAGLNGFVLLLHVGTHPARTDKLYDRLNELVRYLEAKNYQFVRVDELFR